MGCDIHFHVERREGGAWVEVSSGDIYDEFRSYNLFTALAGVRRREGIVPMGEPQYRLPPDASDAVKAASDGWGVDGHSHTWRTLRELQSYDWVGAGVPSFAKSVAKMAALGGPDDVRAVFWFDN